MVAVDPIAKGEHVGWYNGARISEEEADARQVVSWGWGRLGLGIGVRIWVGVGDRGLGMSLRSGLGPGLGAYSGVGVGTRRSDEVRNAEGTGLDVGSD